MATYVLLLSVVAMAALGMSGVEGQALPGRNGCSRDDSLLLGILDRLQKLEIAMEKQQKMDDILRQLHDKLTLVNAYINKTSLNCQSGWIVYKTSCFFIGSEHKSWEQSRQACVNLGSRLIEIETAAENVFLQNYLIQTLGTARETFVWIGSKKVLGQWTWNSNGRTVQNPDWAEGEPSHPGVEDCVSMAGKYNYKWNDESCWKPGQFVCEKK